MKLNLDALKKLAKPKRPTKASGLKSGVSQLGKNLDLERMREYAESQAQQEEVEVSVDPMADLSLSQVEPKIGQAQLSELESRFLRRENSQLYFNFIQQKMSQSSVDYQDAKFVGLTKPDIYQQYLKREFGSRELDSGELHDLIQIDGDFYLNHHIEQLRAKVKSEPLSDEEIEFLREADLDFSSSIIE